MSEEELPNIQIDAGRRQYFVEVKLTEKGRKFLKITERKLLHDGHHERCEIVIFEKDIAKVVEALRVALRCFPDGGDLEMCNEGIKKYE